MITNSVWQDWEDIGIAEAFLIALIAIVIVFLVIVIIIAVTSSIQKGMMVIDKKTTIMPRKENEIVSSDPDAVVAVLAATIEFHKETGKDSRVISIKKVEE